jgi:short-subunit dehydrogenase
MAQNGFAVVTGASSGIGRELAAIFAEHGFDLLVNAEDDVERVVPDLQRYGVSVSSVRADLSTREGVQTLWKAVEANGRPVDAIAINAGVGVGGDFAQETELEAELKMVQLNVTAVVHIAKLAVRQMVKRGVGPPPHHIFDRRHHADSARSCLWRHQSV